MAAQPLKVTNANAWVSYRINIALFIIFASFALNKYPKNKTKRQPNRASAAVNRSASAAFSA